MSPNEEILSAIRYAPGPISAVDIYEQCRSIESIKDVSSRLSQLFAQGKVARTEITTANNRKGFAYSLPKKQPAAAPEPAHAAEPGGDEAGTAGDAVIPASTGSLGEQPSAAAKPKRKPKPKADPVAAGLDQVAAVVAASKPPPQAAKPAQHGSDAALADAILARVRQQLQPMEATLESVASPITISVHIEQIDIHLGGL